MSCIEAVHIFDEHNQLLLSHNYTSRPPPAPQLISEYISRPSPRASLTHLPSLNPPTVLHSYTSDALLFLAPSTSDVPPLAVLEFLHRLSDALSEFLGSPLLASRIEASYDLCAQILSELCDDGLVSSTEANVLRDSVEAPSTLTRLLGGVGLPSSAPGSGSQPRPGTLLSGISNTSASQQPQAAIAWRRSNVRHTSNELYVDVIETISATFAPSGRPISAFAYGSVLCNSRISGVPDLLLILSPPGQQSRTMQGSTPRVHSVVQRPVFHPCIRLARWNSFGELSFVPPDGRFVLAGYEVDLLDASASGTADTDRPPLSSAASSLLSPVSADVSTGLEPTGNGFQVRLSFPPLPSTTATSSSSTMPGRIAAGPRSAAHISSASAGLSIGLSSNESRSVPQIEEVSVTVPLPPGVRKVANLSVTKGDVSFSPADQTVRWRISGKVLAYAGASPPPMVLNCTVVGGGDAHGVSGQDAADLGGTSMIATTYDYDESAAGGTGTYQDADYDVDEKSSSSTGKPQNAVTASHVVASNGKARTDDETSLLMPRCVQVGFAVKGWLASGLRVERLEIDQKRSRGLGEGVRPYKGVKYLTVSKDGVEMRC